ncbi:MAG: MTH1187 family thiamine-binding protein [Desulfarculus sp.]|nr:MTH1187 family thiamine-binding protein [Desulfarculus sp.]
MAVAQFSVVPLGTGDTSLSSYVAGVQRLLAGCGLKSQLTPMGTVLEGPLEEIMAVILKAHELPFGQGAARVMTLINIDDRRDKPGSMEGKVQSVLDKL